MKSTPPGFDFTGLNAWTAPADPLNRRDPNVEIEEYQKVAILVRRHAIHLLASGAGRANNSTTQAQWERLLARLVIAHEHNAEEILVRMARAIATDPTITVPTDTVQLVWPVVAEAVCPPIMSGVGEPYGQSLYDE